MENNNLDPLEPKIQSFSELNIMKDGKVFHNLNDLPPEAQQKIQEALAKLGNNPNLANLIGSFASLAQKSKEAGGAIPITFTQNNSSTVTPIESPEQISSLKSTGYAALNKQRNLNPTFNPHLPGDHLRRNIFIIAATLLIGYLIIKFGFNGKLPF